MWKGGASGARGEAVRADVLSFMLLLCVAMVFKGCCCSRNLLCRPLWTVAFNLLGRCAGFVWVAACERVVLVVAEARQEGQCAR